MKRKFLALTLTTILQICISSVILQEENTSVSTNSNTTEVDISEEINPLCNQFICKEGNCIGDTCVCDYGYTTLKQSNSNFQCDYKRKERIVAVFLEFFFPIGIGHFYIGNYLTGIIKLSLFIVILLSISTGICFSYYAKNSVLAPFFVLCLSIFIFVVWYILDLVKFTFGFYLDGKGEHLL